MPTGDFMGGDRFLALRAHDPYCCVSLTPEADVRPRACNAEQKFGRAV